MEASENEGRTDHTMVSKLEGPISRQTVVAAALFLSG